MCLFLFVKFLEFQNEERRSASQRIKPPLVIPNLSIALRKGEKKEEGETRLLSHARGEWKKRESVVGKTREKNIPKIVTGSHTRLNGSERNRWNFAAASRRRVHIVIPTTANRLTHEITSYEPPTL